MRWKRNFLFILFIFFYLFFFLFYDGRPPYPLAKDLGWDVSLNDGVLVRLKDGALVGLELPVVEFQSPLVIGPFAAEVVILHARHTQSNPY